MTKILEIETCEYCKYLRTDPMDYEKMVCTHPKWVGDFKDLENVLTPFPRWCPLPNKKEEDE